MLEKLIHLVVGMDCKSFLVGFNFQKFLFNITYVGVLEGLFKYLLHESGDNASLQTKEFADIISKMFQILFRQMIAPEIDGREWWHGVDRPYFCIVM